MITTGIYRLCCQRHFQKHPKILVHFILGVPRNSILLILNFLLNSMAFLLEVFLRFVAF